MKEPPIFQNKKVIIFGEVTVDEGSKCVFRPWLDRGSNSLGWEAAMMGGETHYIYVAPIVANPPDSEPTFFLFIGPHGDPDLDRRLGPYNLQGVQQ